MMHSETGFSGQPKYPDRITSCLFLGIVILFPVIHLVGDVIARPSRLPAAFRLMQTGSSLPQQACSERGFVSRVVWYNQRVMDALREFEIQLVREAWPIVPIRDLLQYFLATQLMTGNEQVIVGRHGWLFFRPDVDAITAPNQFAETTVKSGTKSDRVRDPLPAVIQFHEDLKKQGISLLVMPVPSKAAVLASSFLSGRLPTERTSIKRRNSSPAYLAFVDELLARQISVVDLSGALSWSGDSTQPIPFLMADTHWSPAGMNRVAHEVARILSTTFSIRPVGSVQSTVHENRIANLGDTARLLFGPDTSCAKLWVQEVVVNSIHRPSASLTNTTDSEVLLLGDSFTNIYSTNDLGWGESGGLAEQLGHQLNCAVHVIAMNAGGALATRQELLRRIERGEDPLRGKKVVIWQFAERELALGDWRVIPTPAASGPDATTSVASSFADVIEGTIQTASKTPDPRSTPYRDCLIAMHLTNVRNLANGQSTASECVVFVWGLLEGHVTVMSRWKTGDRVQLRLTPWSRRERDLGRIARVELDDPEFKLIDLPTYFAEQPESLK